MPLPSNGTKKKKRLPRRDVNLFRHQMIACLICCMIVSSSAVQLVSESSNFYLLNGEPFNRKLATFQCDETEPSRTFDITNDNGDDYQVIIVCNPPEEKYQPVLLGWVPENVIQYITSICLTNSDAFTRNTTRNYVTRDEASATDTGGNPINLQSFDGYETYHGGRPELHSSRRHSTQSMSGSHKRPSSAHTVKEGMRSNMPKLHNVDDPAVRMAMRHYHELSGHNFPVNRMTHNGGLHYSTLGTGSRHTTTQRLPDGAVLLLATHPNTAFIAGVVCLMGGCGDDDAIGEAIAALSAKIDTLANNQARLNAQLQDYITQNTELQEQQAEQNDIFTSLIEENTNALSYSLEAIDAAQKATDLLREYTEDQFEVVFTGLSDIATEVVGVQDDISQLAAGVDATVEAVMVRFAQFANATEIQFNQISNDMVNLAKDNTERTLELNQLLGTLTGLMFDLFNKKQLRRELTRGIQSVITTAENTDYVPFLRDVGEPPLNRERDETEWNTFNHITIETVTILHADDTTDTVFEEQMDIVCEANHILSNTPLWYTWERLAQNFGPGACIRPQDQLATDTNATICKCWIEARQRTCGMRTDINYTRTEGSIWHDTQSLDPFFSGDVCDGAVSTTLFGGQSLNILLDFAEFQLFMFDYICSSGANDDGGYILFSGNLQRGVVGIPATNDVDGFCPVSITTDENKIKSMYSAGKKYADDFVVDNVITNIFWMIQNGFRSFLSNTTFHENKYNGRMPSDVGVKPILFNTDEEFADIMESFPCYYAPMLLVDEVAGYQPVYSMIPVSTSPTVTATLVTYDEFGSPVQTPLEVSGSITAQEDQQLLPGRMIFYGDPSVIFDPDNPNTDRSGFDVPDVESSVSNQAKGKAGGVNYLMTPDPGCTTLQCWIDIHGEVFDAWDGGASIGHYKRTISQVTPTGGISNTYQGAISGLRQFKCQESYASDGTLCLLIDNYWVRVSTASAGYSNDAVSFYPRRFDTIVTVTIPEGKVTNLIFSSCPKYSPLSSPVIAADYEIPLINNNEETDMTVCMHVFSTNAATDDVAGECDIHEDVTIPGGGTFMYQILRCRSEMSFEVYRLDATVTNGATCTENIPATLLCTSADVSIDEAASSLIQGAATTGSVKEISISTTSAIFSSLTNLITDINVNQMALMAAIAQLSTEQGVNIFEYGFFESDEITDILNDVVDNIGQSSDTILDIQDGLEDKVNSTEFQNAYDKYKDEVNNNVQSANETIQVVDSLLDNLKKVQVNASLTLAALQNTTAKLLITLEENTAAWADVASGFRDFRDAWEASRSSSFLGFLQGGVDGLVGIGEAFTNTMGDLWGGFGDMFSGSFGWLGGVLASLISIALPCLIVLGVCALCARSAICAKGMMTVFPFAKTAAASKAAQVVAASGGGKGGGAAGLLGAMGGLGGLAGLAGLAGGAAPAATAPLVKTIVGSITPAIKAAVAGELLKMRKQSYEDTRDLLRKYDTARRRQEYDKSKGKDTKELDIDDSDFDMSESDSELDLTADTGQIALQNLLSKSTTTSGRPGYLDYKDGDSSSSSYDEEEGEGDDRYNNLFGSPFVYNESHGNPGGVQESTQLLYPGIGSTSLDSVQIE